MGSLPAGECIGGEAAMNEGNVGLKIWMLQVMKIIPELGGGQKALKTINSSP